MLNWEAPHAVLLFAVLLVPSLQCIFVLRRCLSKFGFIFGLSLVPTQFGQSLLPLWAFPDASSVFSVLVLPLLRCDLSRFLRAS